MCISYGTLLASALLQASLSVALPLSLCLSIVHNYTIRLLNRLMRPPLPAVAAPFTETTGRARASSSLLSLPPSFRLARILEILTVTYRRRPVPPRSCALLRAPDFSTSARARARTHASRLFTRALFRFQFHRTRLLATRIQTRKRVTEFSPEPSRFHHRDQTPAITFIVRVASRSACVSDLIYSRVLWYFASRGVLATFPAHLVRRAFLDHGRKRAKV